MITKENKFSKKLSSKKVQMAPSFAQDLARDLIQVKADRWADWGTDQKALQRWMEASVEETVMGTSNPRSRSPKVPAFSPFDHRVYVPSEATHIKVSCFWEDPKPDDTSASPQAAFHDSTIGRKTSGSALGDDPSNVASAVSQGKSLDLLTRNDKDKVLGPTTSSSQGMLQEVLPFTYQDTKKGDEEWGDYQSYI